MFVVELTSAGFVNTTLISREKRASGAILGALKGLGAVILQTASPSNGNSETWRIPSGQVIDANSCWEDGSGPCPNGNCLDYDGRRGIVITEKQVGCKFFCYHRADCKKQYCCNEV